MECIAWEPDKRALFNGLNKEIDSATIVKCMLKSDTKWKLVQAFVKNEDVERLLQQISRNKLRQGIVRSRR